MSIVKYRRFKRLAAALLALLAFALPFARSEQDEPQYIENEWNFVENSMDVSGGIPENATEGLARIREAGVLRVGTEPYFAPQEFIDPALSGQDQYVGSDMELARLIAERMGVELEIIPMAFTDVFNAVAEGKCDLVISALSYTAERSAKAELSKGYHYSEEGDVSVMIVREEDLDVIRSIEDLADRNVVAQRGSVQEALMAEYVQDYLEFRRLDQMQDVYQFVQEGRADAAIGNIENLQVYLDRNPDCGLAPVPGLTFKPDEQFNGDRIAARKGEVQLMYFVNGVIDEVLASGQYESWFMQAAERANELGL